MPCENQYRAIGQGLGADRCSAELWGGTPQCERLISKAKVTRSSGTLCCLPSQFLNASVLVYLVDINTLIPECSHFTGHWRVFGSALPAEATRTSVVVSVRQACAVLGTGCCWGEEHSAPRLYSRRRQACAHPHNVTQDGAWSGQRRQC